MARVVRTVCLSFAAIVLAAVLESGAAPPRPKFPPPDNEQAVADFSCRARDSSCENEFFFGLAPAPVEDDLNDSWLEFAQTSNQVRVSDDNHDYLKAMGAGDIWVAAGWSSDIIPYSKRDSIVSVYAPESGTSLWADLWLQHLRTTENIVRGPSPWSFGGLISACNRHEPANL